MLSNRRKHARIITNWPVEITVGSQVIIRGQLKDLSFKSAFIRMKSSVYMELNDELNFQIKCTPDNAEQTVSGEARISRIAAGEGIVIYFTKLIGDSSSRLQQLVAG